MRDRNSLPHLLILLLFSGGVYAAPVTVDRYGQYTGEIWPGKITSDEQLQADAAREAAELAEARPTKPERFDRYGGVIAGEPRKATGFFRTEKIDGRWWLITPEGNRFYLKGVDAIHHGEGGYYTRLTDAKGMPRKEFAEPPPDRETFPDAHRDNTLNYLTANLRRKYGPEYPERWRETMKKRMAAAGFNAVGKWNWPNFNELPFLVDTKFVELKRFGRRCLDPFDPGFAEGIRPRIERVTARYRNDPMLIGYQFENENGWGREDVDALLADTTGKSAAKRALLERISERESGDPGRLFGKSGATMETLLKQRLNPEKLPEELRSEFLLAASRRYHSILVEELRSRDPGHLFLAASHFDYQSVEWITGAMEYVDVLAFNEYDFESRWLGSQIAELLRKWDRPFAVTEFSFPSGRRGYTPFRVSTDAATEKDRGLAFRGYTERLAANPLCVGSTYFLMYDQPVTCRAKDTEAHNFGLFNVVDQPYREMLAEVRKANERLFEIHAGTLSPEETRPNLPRLAPIQRLKAAFLPESVSNLLFCDAAQPEYFGGKTDRLRFHRSAPLNRPLQLGILDAGKPDGFRKVELAVFLWSKAKNRNLADWVRLEESPDNRAFTPVPFRILSKRDLVYDEYTIAPEQLKPDTRYLKVSFILREYGAVWAVSLAEVTVERR